MTPRAVVLAVLALGACTSAPTLHVAVKNPDGLPIARTVVSIYESNTLSCQGIEYGDVTDAELGGALVASETLPAMGAPEGSLDNLSRTDPKLVVARAFGSDGSLLAAGCTEKGEVVGADTVEVATEAAAIASVGLADPSLMTDRYGIAVSAVDAKGAPLDLRQVWWRVWGPTGTKPYDATNLTTAIDGVPHDGVWQPTQPSCTMGATATVHPMPPDLVSGYAIQMRVAWAATQPPLITSLTTIDLSSALLTAPPSSSKFCALGRDAIGPAVVCLEDAGASANVYRISPSDGDLATRQTVMTFMTPRPFAVFSLPGSGGTDVYAAMPSGAPVHLFGPSTAATLPCTGCDLVALDDVLVAPACGSGPDAQPAQILLHDPAGVGMLKVHVFALDPASGTLHSIVTQDDVALDSAGCVSRLDATTGQPSQTQVYTLDPPLLASGGSPTSIALSSCTPGAAGVLACTRTTLPTPDAPVAFTGGAAPEMIVPGVDATGAVLIYAVLDSDGRLLELSRRPAVSVPHRIVTGQFDRDGATDLAFDVLGLRAGSLFDLTYARQVDGQPLAALAPLRSRANATPIAITDLFTADLDGNGVDDLVLVGREVASSAYGLSVVLLGVPETPAQLPFPTDPPADPMTCPP